MLKKFWFGAQKDITLDTNSDTEDGEYDKLLYLANTMKNFQCALNQCLYDIINTSNLSFKHSKKAFFAKKKWAKGEGKRAKLLSSRDTRIIYQLHSFLFINWIIFMRKKM